MCLVPNAWRRFSGGHLQLRVTKDYGNNNYNGTTAFGVMTEVSRPGPPSIPQQITGAMMQITRRVVRSLLLTGMLVTACGPQLALAASAHITILRDEWGVPHINAATEVDGFYALGWAEAEDQLNAKINGQPAPVIYANATNAYAVTTPHYIDQAEKLESRARLKEVAFNLEQQDPRVKSVEKLTWSPPWNLLGR